MSRVSYVKSQLYEYQLCYESDSQAQLCQFQSCKYQLCARRKKLLQKFHILDDILWFQIICFSVIAKPPKYNSVLYDFVLILFSKNSR